MFKLVLICNDLPGITTNDPAVWNRLRVIPFESTFTDNPPADEDEQFQKKIFLKDENFDEKIANMLEPLFWILVNRLKTIKKIIYEPAKVKEATERYRRAQDIFAQFIDERVVAEEGKIVNLMDFYVAFRDWHKQSSPGIQIPAKNDCYDYLLDYWNKPMPGYKWAGYRLRTERDDLAEGKAEEVASTEWGEAGGNPLASMARRK